MTQSESANSTVENTTPSPTPKSEARVAELLLRYEQGEFEPHIRKRLAEIFANNPPDAWKRLEIACDYLEITGDALDDVDGDDS